MTGTFRSPRPALAALLAATLAVLAGAAPAQGAPDTSQNVYFISTSGVDTALPTNQQPDCDGGAIGTAWRSIEFGMRCLDPGDVLYIRGGTYNEHVLPASVGAPPDEVIPATAERPILVTNYPGERVELRGLYRLKGADHWTIDGLNVSWDGVTGTSVFLVRMIAGRNWTVRNSELRDAHSYGAVSIGPGTAGEPSDWRFLDNCVHDTAAVHTNAGDQNVYVQTGLGNGPGLVEGNLLYGAPGGSNIKLGVGSSTTDGVSGVSLRYNTMHGGLSNAILSSASRDNLIERNLTSTALAYPAKSWAPNIRGFQVTGTNNVARNNSGFEAGSVVFSGYDSPEPITDGGGNVMVDPQFDGTDSCGAFRPLNAEAAAYGHTRVAETRVVGNWDGVRGDDPGVARLGRYGFRNSTTVGLASSTGGVGTATPFDAGDVALLGDWDGDGDATPGFVKGNRWYLRNGPSGGEIVPSFSYGQRGDRFVVGDWDGNGTDTPGLVRGNSWALKNSSRGGAPDATFRWGYATDQKLVGDWDGNGTDTPGLVRVVNRQLRWLLNDRLGPAPVSPFVYGSPGDEPIVGDWDGNGTDTPGVVRGANGWILRDTRVSGPARRIFSFDG